MGLDAASKCAEQCNTVEDTNASKKLFTDYCVLKGYNPVGSPTVFTGTPTVTVTVTAAAGVTYPQSVGTAALLSWVNLWLALM